jgi:Uncharacterized protein family UPF0016
MDINWTHAGPSILAVFLASLVECVEALTVVLAVGTVRGWSGALSGTIAALAVLMAMIGALGRALTRIPLEVIQLVVGALLLLFGLRWLRKAILRSAGRIAMHDEQAAFSKNTAAMHTIGSVRGWGWFVAAGQLRGTGGFGACPSHGFCASSSARQCTRKCVEVRRWSPALRLWYVLGGRGIRSRLARCGLVHPRLDRRLSCDRTDQRVALPHRSEFASCVECSIGVSG